MSMTEVCGTCIHARKAGRVTVYCAYFGMVISANYGNCKHYQTAENGGKPDGEVAQGDAETKSA